MRSNTQKIISQSVTSDYLKQFQNSKKNVKKNIPYPTNATYALTRRLIVPRWWIESLLFTLGKKHAWYENFLQDRVDQRIYECFKPTSNNIFLMFFIWHEVTKVLFSPDDKVSSKICLDLTPFLRGSEKQNARILSTLEETLIKPSKMLDISTIEKQSHKELVIEKAGFVNIFRQVHLEQNVDGIWLTLHFAQRLSNLFVAPDCKNKTKTKTNNFVSINPNLFYAMGSRVNLQVAMNGLFLEYQKQVETEDEDFTVFKIAADKLDSFYSQSIKTTKLLFEHGMIRGFQNIPDTKISQLRETQNALDPDEDASIVFSWNIAGQTKEARNFEKLLSKNLAQTRTHNLQKTKTAIFKEPPADELRKIREAHERTIKNVPLRANIDKPKQEYVTELKVETKQEHTEHFSFSGKPAKETPNFHKCTERELSIFVARFYESLNQKQKKMFESERRKMNNEQFRAFMIPILQRTHSRLPT